MDGRIVTMRQAAALLGVRRQTIAGWVKLGYVRVVARDHQTGNSIVYGEAAARAELLSARRSQGVRATPARKPPVAAAERVRDRPGLCPCEQVARADGHSLTAADYVELSRRREKFEALNQQNPGRVVA